MRKRLLMSVILMVIMIFTLALQSSANTIPHPLSSYRVREFRASEDAVRNKYSVTMESEDEVFPWREYSYATLYSKEVAETWAMRHAYLHSLTASQREALIKKELDYLNEHILFQLFLRSQERDSYLYTNIVNFNPEIKTFEPRVTRILLETDDGRIIEAMERLPGSSTTSGGSWRAYNSVVFPAVDEKGEPLIKENTEWIYLWLVTDTYRVYFPFHFE